MGFSVGSLHLVAVYNMHPGKPEVILQVRDPLVTTEMFRLSANELRTLANFISAESRNSEIAFDDDHCTLFLERQNEALHYEVRRHGNYHLLYRHDLTMAERELFGIFVATITLRLSGKELAF